MLADFGKIAETINYQAPRCALISNVTGQIMKAVTAEYWVDHARSAVDFQRGMQTLKEAECTVFIEVGPKPVLLGLGAQCITAEEEGSPMHWLPSLRPGRNDWEVLLETLGQLYIHGVKVDWQGFDAPYNREKVVLPTYPFQRQRYWAKALDEKKQIRHQIALPDKEIHPLLGRCLASCLASTKEIVYQQTLSLEVLPYLQDHQVFDTVIFPGAGYVEIALAVGQAVLERSDKIADDLTAPKLALDDLSIESPLSLTREQEALIQVILTPEEEDRDSAYWVAIYSQEMALDNQAGTKW